MYTSLQDAYVAAFAVTLDRLRDSDPSGITVELHAGDGATLTARSLKGSVCVEIGGAAEDEEAVYYTLDSVRTSLERNHNFWE